MDTKKIKVMKFGGSCLADADGFSRVVEIISGDSDCIIVMSALKGVTSSIIWYMSQSPGKIDMSGLSDFLFKRHMEIAELALKGVFLNNYRRDLKSSLERMEELEMIMSGNAEKPERISAFLQSFGERLSVDLTVAALRQAGKSAVGYQADDLGVITEGDYLNGIVSIEKTALNIRDTLIKDVMYGKIPVITGYIGRNTKGETTLLGRDGSDYTASVVASCVGSMNLTLWKDVDGIMTGDPKDQVACRVLRNLSYDQAEKISLGGAKIVHPLAVSQARKEMVSIRVRSVYDPFSDGTLIEDDGFRQP
ncbi:MAG: amino acid kinase family protein [Thermoplasmataceae archaeon]